MSLQLIATDLDGTLLRSDGTVSHRSQQALLAAEAAGLKVVFVTGRPLRWAEDVFDHVGSHGFVIISNGALTWDVANHAVVHQRPMDPQVGLEIAQLLRAEIPDTYFASETLDGIVLEPGFMQQLRLPAQARRVELPEVFSAPVLKLLARHEELDPEVFWEHAKELAAHTAEITWSSAGALLEMSATGVTKATTLAQFCDAYGIKPSQVVAFGDMPNDVEMLAWAGTAYAMANADSRVKQVADHLTLSNDEDGVAVVIEQLLAGRSPHSLVGAR